MPHVSLVPVTAQSADGTTAASFVPEANMVCSSLLVGGSERLSQRRGLEAYAEQGSTMGVPLLLPWANRLGRRSFRVAGRQVSLPHDPARVHEDGDGTPLHGLTPSLMRWSEVSIEPAGVSAHLRWTSAELLELFPFAHELSYVAELAPNALTVTLTVRADHGDPVPVAFGFHPYLRLGDSARAEWTIELPPCRQLELDERMLPTGATRPSPPGPVSLGDRGFDDAFALEEPAGRFLARAGGRCLSVELMEGFPFAQIFSPPGADFVCFEPMSAPANGLVSGEGLSVLEPGEERRSRFRITVSD